MFRTLLSTGFLFTAIQSANAEACHDRFVELLTVGNGKELPTKSHITTEPKKGSVMVNEFYYQKTGHWMTVMLEPKQPWTLAHDNVMYISTDEGKSWKKIRTMDSEKNERNVKAAMEKNSKTSSNTVCGEEELEGELHEYVKGDYLHILDNYKAEQHHEYWVNKKTGWIRKAVSHTRSDNYEAKTTQIMEQVSDMSLPTPTAQ